MDDFGPAIVRSAPEGIVIYLPKLFRDENWANSFGVVQNEIENCVIDNLPNQQGQREILFDFSMCRWIDPLPAMSILVEVAKARHLALPIAMKFPKPDDGPDLSTSGPYQTSPNRLLWFLAQEGFLSSLDSLGGDGIRYLGYPNYGWDTYKKLNIKPSYEDARCIPMRLLNIPEIVDGEFAGRTVDSLLIGVEPTLASKIHPHTRERLLYKLRLTIQEILHNAQEHAYRTDESLRIFALYVRYRTGGVNLNSVGKHDFQQCVDQEYAHCPKLSRDWLPAYPGCLEVFTLDRGIGMVESFKNAKILLEEKYKFNQAMRMTFLDGCSTKQERQTRYGGLHLLHNLLKDTGDFVRALEGGIWFGSNVPFQRRGEQTFRLTESQASINGLAMHLRLSWKVEADHGPRWAEFTQSKDSEVWDELKIDEDACTPSFSWFEAQTVVDERFGDTKEYSGNGSWILWLTRPHRMKWDILTFIERNIAPKAAGNTVLIIGDIPSYEAETYAAALSEFSAPHTVDWPSKFSKVILATNRWRFAAVDSLKHEKRYGFSNLHENINTLKIRLPPISPRPLNFRLSIVRWLKWHDSRRFWEKIEYLRQAYIPRLIDWGIDREGKHMAIKGYLDFPQTVHDVLCAAIYRRALSRVLGILKSGQVKIYCIDHLTISILLEIQTEEVYEPSSTAASDSRLALGSVLVSGSTLDASASHTFDVHFFVHPSSSLRGQKSALLFWLPRTEVSDEASNLARIGKTATIGPEGWKSYEVPRFDAEGKCVGARNPQQTYEDWQGNIALLYRLWNS